jgi:hypothetical protein
MIPSFTDLPQYESTQRDAFVLKNGVHLWNIFKRGHPFLDSPFPLIIKLLVKLFIITLVILECYHFYFRDGISKINQLSLFENYENTAILRAIDSVKRDATFGTAHLIIGVNTAPDNPPAWTFTVQVIVVLSLTPSAVK